MGDAAKRSLVGFIGLMEGGLGSKVKGAVVALVWVWFSGLMVFYERADPAKNGTFL